MKRKNIYSVWITCYCCSSYSYIIFYLSCEHFKSNSSVFRSEPRCENQPYLPRSLHVDGDDVEAVAAQLAGPAASLADPLQQAVLVGVTHRAVAPTRVQQVALQTGEYRNTLQETKQQLQQKYYNQMVQTDLFSNLVIIFDSVVSCWATWLPELLYVMVRSSRFKPYIIVDLLYFDSFEFELN